MKTRNNIYVIHVSMDFNLKKNTNQTNGPKHLINEAHNCTLDKYIVCMVKVISV